MEKAERKDRTLIEMARCLFIDVGLPKSFWGEAVSTRSTNLTPHELWYGTKPY